MNEQVEILTELLQEAREKLKNATVPDLKKFWSKEVLRLETKLYNSLQEDCED